MLLVARSLISSSIALLLLLLPPAAFAAEQASARVELFTTSQLPKRDYPNNVVVYEVDALDELTASLSMKLPGEEQAAKEEALRRISRLGDELRWTVEYAIEGLTRAKSYGLTKLPAVVFDGGAKVVYGEPDIDRALEHYRQSVSQ